MNNTPFRVQSQAVHQQRERGKHLSDAPAVIGRIEMDYPQAFDLRGLVANTLNIFRADRRLVVFNLRNARLGHEL